jgi:hypothetical protein
MCGQAAAGGLPGEIRIRKVSDEQSCPEIMPQPLQIPSLIQSSKSSWPRSGLPIGISFARPSDAERSSSDIQSSRRIELWGRRSASNMIRDCRRPRAIRRILLHYSPPDSSMASTAGVSAAEPNWRKTAWATSSRKHVSDSKAWLKIS